jgi:hypothetical protein
MSKIHHGHLRSQFVQNLVRQGYMALACIVGVRPSTILYIDIVIRPTADGLRRIHRVRPNDDTDGAE